MSISDTLEELEKAVSQLATGPIGYTKQALIESIGFSISKYREEIGSGLFLPITGGVVTGQVTIAVGAVPANTYTEPFIVEGGDGEFMLIANVGGGNTQWGGGLRGGRVGLSGDGGLRLEHNWHYPTTTPSGKHFNPTVGRGVAGVDSLGTLSYSWDPAKDAGASWDERQGFNFAGGYDWFTNALYADDRVQSLIVKQTFNSATPVGVGGGAFNGHVQIATMRAGHTLGFYTSNVVNDPKLAMLITGHASPGNVNIYRTLVVGVGNIAAIPQMKFNPIAGLLTSGEGQLVYNGTNLLFEKAGGVVITLA